MKILAFNKNGRVSLVIPAQGTTIAQMRLVVPVGVEAVEIEDTDVPQDRAWRNAWELQGKNITVSLAKAKAVHLERLQKTSLDDLPATVADRIEAAASLAELEAIT